MKKFTLMFSLFAVFLLAGCENPIYQWLLPEKKDSPLGPLDVNNGWDSSKRGSYMHSLQAWGGDGEVYLSWISPSETEFDRVRIIYSDSAEEIQSIAARTVSSEVIATENERPTKITGLENGRIYYFAVTPMDEQGAELGQPLIISAVPHVSDQERPDDVEDLDGVPGSGTVSLTWDLPDSHFAAAPPHPKRVESVSVSVVPLITPEPHINGDMKGASLTGLQNGKPYSLYIRTVNAQGKRSYGVSMVVIPVAPNDAEAIKNLLWVGAWDTPAQAIEAHGSLAQGLAYYNTDDQKAYVYVGTPSDGVWKEMTGVPAAGGLWAGALAGPPAPAENGMAYYNTTDGKAYVNTGGAWQAMSAATAAGGLWAGALANPPAAADGLAYYNTGDGQAYVYVGTPPGGAWQAMGSMTAYYQVKFNSQGGSFISPQLVAGGTSAVKPEPGPVRAGFTFAGWYDASAGGSLYLFPAVSGPVEVFAHWTDWPETLLDDFPAGSVIDGVWYISNADEWNAAVAAINAGGDGTNATNRKNYILYITGSFALEGKAVLSAAKTFDAEYITVAIRGGGTEIIKLSAYSNTEVDHINRKNCLLYIGQDQRVLVRGLVLEGWTKNSLDADKYCYWPVVYSSYTNAEFWLREGGRITGHSGGGITIDGANGKVVMDGNAAVSGNTKTYLSASSGMKGGGVHVKGENAAFSMSGSASVSENVLTAKTLTAFGGGVCIEGKNAKFSMGGSASVSDNEAVALANAANGGGVYLMDTGNGAFIMSGNASVSGNTLTASGNTSNSSYISYGGGVYAVITAATTAYMKGNASISRNTIKSFNPLPQDNARGGGLYMATANSAPNATFIMDENASVSENSMESATTNLLGGGVYLNYSASMVMAGNASVSGNSLTVSSGDFKVFGGGVYGSSNKNVLSMYGNASIAGNRISTTYNNNQAARGGGIYLYQSQFFIYSGIVYGNSATLPERLRNTAKYRTGTGPGPIDGQESAIYPSYPAVSKYYKQGDGLTNIGSDFNKTIQVSSGVLFRY